jgi:hypothetical protein
MLNLKNLTKVNITFFKDKHPYLIIGKEEFETRYLKDHRGKKYFFALFL